MDDTPAIQTRGLRKVYPAPGRRRGRAGGFPPPRGSAPATVQAGEAGLEIVALKHLDLEVRAGEFFGLLGPNGAGKTTTIGILTTRVRATAGEAFVGGADVSKAPVDVRRRIGVVPQRPNPDRGLTTLENLVFHAAYFGIGMAEAASRGRALLDRLEIGDRANAKVDHLSGGQQQRLMIARALIHQPAVLFLDEPTVGLDPQARLDLWEILRDLHGEGRTIVMTTHYMEEADRLCERLAIVDRGQLLALDSPVRLKARAPGGTLVEVSVDGPADTLVDQPGPPELASLEVKGGTIRGYAERPAEAVAWLIRQAEEAGRTVTDIHLTPPSLETLFISLTGRKID